MQPYPTYQNYLNYPQQNQPMYPYGNIMQQMAAQNLAGKTVNDFNEITANDVPMDGRNAIFPKSDFSEIVVKNWGADGSIRTIAFKPVLPTDPSNGMSNSVKADSDAFGDVLRGIQNDIKTLNEKLDKISKPVKGRKEAEDE